jgi:hypothetical protein
MPASRLLTIGILLIVAVCAPAAASMQSGDPPPPQQDPGTQKPPPKEPQQPPAEPQQPPAEPQQPVPQEPTAPVPAGAGGAGGPTGSLPVYGGAAATSKIFNPDIAVIGNFLGTFGENTIEPAPLLSMKESEFSFQAIVDPYARADFFVAFSEEGAELEEGYITFLTLPAGLLMKVGKMRADFGKLNPLHPHVLPWADRPLVYRNLLGGDEGIADAGVSLSALIPNPWLFLEATGQVFRGEAGEGEIFFPSERSDVAVVGRLRGYQDITESTNVDLGVSFARGHNGAGIVDDVDIGRFTTDLFGIDATVRWKPLRRAIYRSFIARTEAVWSRREQFNGRQAAMGFFVSGDYQLGRRWFAGVRFDRSERAHDEEARDTGQALTLTFWPSEFNQIRGQLRRTKYAEGEDAHEFLLQFQFSIGAHGAHPF